MSRRSRPTTPSAIANAIANLRYSLFYRNSRSLGAPELQSPLVRSRSDGYVDFRITGRDIRLRIDVASADHPAVHARRSI